MAMLNICIFDSCCNKILISWTIYELKDERLSLRDFYGHVGCKLEESHSLQEARVGRSKEELDAISDLGISVLSVVSAFGKYLKFYVSSQHEKVLAVPTQRNAFEVLMASQCRLNQFLRDLSFSCGATLEEAELPKEFEGVVYVIRMSCHEPVERLYYRADFKDICIHCVDEEVGTWSRLSTMSGLCRQT